MVIFGNLQKVCGPPDLGRGPRSLIAGLLGNCSGPPDGIMDRLIWRARAAAASSGQRRGRDGGGWG